MKQSFSWWSFANRGLSDRELLSEAKAIGYDGVELLDRSLFDTACEIGLEIVSYNCHSSIDAGLNNPKNHDDIFAEFETSLALAADYGIKKLIAFSGCRGDEITDDDGLRGTVIGLKRLAPLAESAGVQIVLELLNSRIDHKRYQCDSTAWAVSAIAQTASPNVRLLYDIYHAQVMEGDLIRTIQCCAPFIGHYHTAGCPGRHELDQNQEIYYPAVIKAIAATGYDDYIGHELIPTTHPRYALITAYELTYIASVSNC